MTEQHESYVALHHQWVKTMQIQSDGMYKDIQSVREELRAKLALLQATNEHIIISQKTFNKWLKNEEIKAKAKIVKARKQFCRSCGNEWKGIHARCPKCGKKLDQQEQGEG